MAKTKTRVWTCQRSAAGVKCGQVNPRRKQLCAKCGKRRPASKKPAHMAALEIPYEEYIKLNGGEFCGVCGKPPGKKRLDRDHEHRGTGKPRGLLCSVCNRRLTDRVNAEWLTKAVAYLQRTS